jgi:serine protease Do
VLEDVRKIMRAFGTLLFGLAITVAITIAPAVARAGEVDPAVRDAEHARIATIAKLIPTVVAVFQRSAPAGGSGVLISHDGYVLTNFHVAGEDEFFKCGLSDGKLYDAVLVGVDPTGDVAVIKLVGRTDFPIATWGDSDTVRTGDWVYVLGNPFLLASDFQPTATYGIVSGVHRYQYPANTILEYTDCLQVDASVNPGNSGGPLFNAAGELIGINGRISVAQRGRVNAGAGYAISINQIRNFLGGLRSGRIVDHASLGATVSRDSHGGVIVSQILEESDAYRRGLRVDDEIVSFAGRPIHSVNQFKNVLGIFPEDWKVSLVYRRENEKHEIRVRLRSLHAKMDLSEMSAPAEKPQPEGPRPPERPAPPQGPKDKKEPRRNPRRERPRALTRRKEPEIPEKLKKLYQAKSGFANYHFNRVERDRVLHGLDVWGDFKNRGGFQFSGDTATGVHFDCILSGTFASLQTGGKTFLQQFDQDPQDEPPGSGGLLVALNQLRLFLTQREKAFGTLVYFGTEPLDGGSEQVDVLVSSLGSVESRWYFSVSHGALVGFDTRLADDADACEVRFRQMGTFQDIQFPSEIVVRHGDSQFALFRVQHLKERK